MNIAVLDTGLFPDRKTIEHAVATLAPIHGVRCTDVSKPGLIDADWDQVLDQILKCDVVITL